MHDPRDPYFFALKRILRYVRGTIDHGLRLHVSSISQLSTTLQAPPSPPLATKQTKAPPSPPLLAVYSHKSPPPLTTILALHTHPIAAIIHYSITLATTPSIELGHQGFSTLYIAKTPTPFKHTSKFIILLNGVLKKIKEDQERSRKEEINQFEAKKQEKKL
ncbi:hypothetical protein Tco_0784267 [Tanacetum coccineum]